MRLLAVLLVSLAGTAQAETHGGAGLGGFVGIGGPTYGSWISADVWPGGRWGGRLDLFVHETADALTTEASAVYAVGATRPHIVLALRFGAGISVPGPRGVVASGLSVQLFLRKAMLALILDTSLHLAADGDGPDLFLTQGLGLRWIW